MEAQEDNFNYIEFWQENEWCLKNFDKKTRIPVTLNFDDHFLQELVGPFSTIEYYNNHQYKIDIHKKANEILYENLGKRFYSEETDIEPYPVRFEILMGANYKITEGSTPWFESEVENIDDVKRLIERYHKFDLKNEIFKDNLLQRKEEYEKRTNKKVSWGHFTRGPATLATSIIGTTNLCIFMMEEEDVIEEFYVIMGEKLVEYLKLIREASGNFSNSIALLDDDCFLFSPRLYDKFCAPVLEKLFHTFASNKDDRRFQHSDSDMAHLMPILYRLGVNAVNFGPNIHPLEIRRTMPNARIHGQIPPFVLRNGTREEIIDIVKRDMEVALIDGNFIATTAGSVAAGTPMENIKTYIKAVYEFGKIV